MHALLHSVPWPCSRPPLPHVSARDSWILTGKFGSVSCGVTAPFSWVLVHARFCLCLPSLFPQSCVSSIIKFHWPPKSNYLEVLSPFARSPEIGKSVVGPTTFLTVQEFIWYNCSAVCGSSAWRLCGGVNGDLLQEGLCHTLGDPGLLHPKPLPLRQATADLYLCRRQTNTQR